VHHELVALAEKPLDDFDIQRFIPGTHVALDVIAIFQSGAIAGHNAHVIRLIRRRKLGPSHVCGEARTDLDAAGIINTKVAGRIGDREIDKAPGHHGLSARNPGCTNTFL
jgi:hypothetical protein